MIPEYRDSTNPSGNGSVVHDSSHPEKPMIRFVL
jgi:hypothetical protein